MKIIEKNGYIDATDTMYPCEAFLSEGPIEEEAQYSTFYGYCFDNIEICTRKKLLHSGDFFSIPIRYGKFYSSKGKVFLVRKYGFLGQEVYGKVENKGRLSYIDGCSDSILVYPPRKGNPCLNLLYFPPYIEQTPHTHPTIRIGVVLEGKGFAYWKVGETELRIELNSGDMFYLPENELHHFTTEKYLMRLVVFHPDSDWGPTDQDHIMLNRTYMK